MSEMQTRDSSESSWYGDDDIAEVLYPPDLIQARVREIGQAITRDYADKAYEPTHDGSPAVLVISVLRGAAIYMSDLVRSINLPLEMDYMAVSSYGSGVKSSGIVRILKDLSTNVEGRHVIIAEDILDSGLTLKYLMRVLESRKPASIQIATLLRKKTEVQAPVDCAYVGFECPNEFIVGYGLAYAENYRNLPYIGVLKPEVYQGNS